MKYTKHLGAEEEETLWELMRNNPHYRARKRAHAIVLNAAGTPMALV